MSRMYTYIWQRVLIATLVNCGTEVSSDRSPPRETSAEEIVETLRDQAWARDAKLEIASKNDLGTLIVEWANDENLTTPDIATPLANAPLPKTTGESVSILEPQPVSFSGLVPAVEQIVALDSVAILRDTDGDGIDDGQDPCPLDVDHTLVAKFQDQDHDGLVVPSPQPRCQSDVAFPLVAEDLSFYQLDNLDWDDTVAVTAWDELGFVLDADWGLDFNQNRSLSDTEPYYLIANPFQWLDFAANCGSNATTTCSVNVVIVADLDFAVLDGLRNDTIAGDGAYTTSNENDLVSSTDAAEPYSGSVSSLDRTIRNLHIDRDADNTGWFARAADAQFYNFDFVGSINGHSGTAVGLIAHVEGKVLVKNIGFNGDVTGGNAVGSMIGLATTSEQSFAISPQVGYVHAQGRINGRGDVGGLIGRCEATVLLMFAYNLAAVVATDGRAAGIIGALVDGGSGIWGTFNSGAVSATHDASGILNGLAEDSFGNVLNSVYNIGPVTSTGPGTNAAGIFVNSSPSDGMYRLDSVYNAGSVQVLSRWSSSYGIAKNRHDDLNPLSTAMYFLAEDSYGDGIGSSIAREDIYKQQSYDGLSFDRAWQIREGESLPFLTDITPADEIPTID